MDDIEKKLVNEEEENAMPVQDDEENESSLKKPIKKASHKDFLFKSIKYIKFGLLYSVPSFCVVLTFPLWKSFMLPELKKMEDIKAAQEIIQKNDAFQVERFNEITKKIVEIDLIKKDLESATQDLLNQINAVKNLVEIRVKEQEVKDLKNASDSKVDDCERIKNLIKVLRQRLLVKAELESLNQLALTDDFKKLISPLKKVDAEGTPNYEEIISEFEVILEAMPSQSSGSNMQASKKLSEKILNQVKSNIKITVDGKEVNHFKKETVEEIRQLLKEKDLKKAIDLVESLENESFTTWLQKAKDRKIIDDVIFDLLNYSGAVTQ